MRSRLVTLVVMGAAGLVLGAGIGVASARTGGISPRGPVEASAIGDSVPTDGATMDEMHDAMRGQMPVAMREACDDMHARMGGHAGSTDSTGMGSMMGADDTDHAAHHS